MKKILKTVRYFVLCSIYNSPHRPKLFLSYWHYRLRGKYPKGNRESFYLGAAPNSSAGIGHQMANWIAGYWWAKEFGLKYAHTAFPSSSWEKFLGLGVNETTVDDLLDTKGYKLVALPPFNEMYPLERDLVENIIASYQDRKIVFLLCKDQSYAEQIGVIDDLQRKFHQAPSRKHDQLVFSKDFFNIAVHVRRGDIVHGQKTGFANHQMRWQDNDYFKNVLGNVLKVLKTDKPIAIYLFSQGVPEDFRDFEYFDNLRLCLDMNAQDSFLHMVFADLLITSKSSFSYKPALLSKGIRVCPKDFWHGYPTDKKWILADADGEIGPNRIEAGA